MCNYSIYISKAGCLGNNFKSNLNCLCECVMLFSLLCVVFELFVGVLYHSAKEEN